MSTRSPSMRSPGGCIVRAAGGWSLSAVAAGSDTVLGSVAIPQGTHSVAVDPRTHRVWIAYADKDHSYVQAFAPAAAEKWPFRPNVTGSLRQARGGSLHAAEFRGAWVPIPLSALRGEREGPIANAMGG